MQDPAEACESLTSWAMGTRSACIVPFCYVRIVVRRALLLLCLTPVERGAKRWRTCLACALIMLRAHAQLHIAQSTFSTHLMSSQSFKSHVRNIHMRRLEDAAFGNGISQNLVHHVGDSVSNPTSL